jgi:hypothetical protein
MSRSRKTKVVAVEESRDQAEIDAMEQQREAAYDAVYTWHGQPLHPFSSGRDGIYRKLAALDFPVSTKVMIRSGFACLGDARLLLFVCAHDYEQLWPFRHDMDALLGKAYQWADQNIGHHEDTAAIELWKRILADSRATQAIHRPGGKKDLGEGN